MDDYGTFFIDKVGAPVKTTQVATSGKDPNILLPSWYLSALENSVVTVEKQAMSSKPPRHISYSFSLKSDMSRVRQASFLHGTSLVAAVDEKGWLAIFQVCENSFKKVQSIRLPSMQNISFVQANHELLIVGERRYIYSFDLKSSTVNKIHIAVPASKIHLSHDSKTFALLDTTNKRISLHNTLNKQRIHDLTMQSAVTGISFSADDARLHIACADRNIYTFWVEKRKFLDCVHTLQFGVPSCVSTSSRDGILAIGSQSGSVSCYDAANTNDLIFESDHLTTSIDGIAFSNTSPYCVIFSSQKRNSSRLLRCDTGEVCRKWPSRNEPLGYITTCDIHNGHVLFGNSKGGLFIYSLAN